MIVGDVFADFVEGVLEKVLQDLENVDQGKAGRTALADRAGEIVMQYGSDVR